jgi:hypothetical protein
MAKFAATDYVITINSTPVSTNLNSVELSLEADDLETTHFGEADRSRIGGLQNATLTLNFMQDFGAGAIDQLLFPLLGQIAEVTIKHKNEDVAGQNPLYIANCLVTQYSPFASSIGDIATLSVTWPVSDDVIKLTEPEV